MWGKQYRGSSLITVGGDWSKVSVITLNRMSMGGLRTIRRTGKHHSNSREVAELWMVTQWVTLLSLLSNECRRTSRTAANIGAEVTVCPPHLHTEFFPLRNYSPRVATRQGRSDLTGYGAFYR